MRPAARPGSGSGPILVTGAPRSGTTWLARFIAQAPGMALAGREPMNPRNRQYALGRTLDGWARIATPTARQRRALRSAYRGLNPWTYSRYGYRQWAAVLPRTRVVIKDPFALMSVPMVVRETGCTAVVVYRHPGAVLASYRRMGWSPDLAELQRIVESTRAEGGPEIADLLDARGCATDVDEATAMGRFWSALHEFLLHDLAETQSGGQAAGAVHVVSHERLATGGVTAGRQFADAVGIGWTQAMAAELSREAGGPSSETALHNFDRSPAAVAEGWRRNVSEDEVAAIEKVALPTYEKLERVALTLAPGGSDR